MQSVRRAGFSLIEALVVLAIGGLALAVIFSIGVRAGDTGFKLGRGAMAAADEDIAVSDIRTIVRSIALRPDWAFVTGVDEPMEGRADRLEIDVVMERATQCAPEGWAGRLVLAIQPMADDAGSIVTCQAGSNAAAPLLTLPGREAAFAYSVDGAVWTDTFENTPEPVAPDPLLPLDLWIRVGNDRLSILELASSGPPELWLRSDVFG